MTRSLTVVALASFAATATARAEKEPLSPEELRKTATHVVVGQVTAVYTRAETAGDWKYTHYVAEVRVAESEKGDRLKKGDLVYARYWHRQWVGASKQPPSTAGHGPVPAQGEAVRVYLARNAYDGFTTDNHDGGFNVIGGNGFEPLKPAGK
jgi:hypothetical protein